MPLKYAFCCVGLKTGTLIIGWVNLVLGLALAVVGAIAIALAFDKGDGGAKPTSAPVDYGITVTVLTVTITYTILFVVTVLHAAVFASLLYGTYNNRPGFLMPFMVVYGVLLVVAGISIIFWVVMGMQEGLLAPQIIVVCKLFIPAYFLCIVGSYYKELRSASRQHAV